MKYFIYCRKSTDSEERQILSIESQIAELKEFASKERLEIIEILCESQTAKEPGRPVFNKMLDRISAEEADGILAWHPDRLARNSIDGGKVIYMLDKGQIKDLKFPTFWFDSTPQGKFMLSIAFGQSKYYIDNLSENIRRGHRQKLRKGIWPGFAPVGYLNNHKTKAVDLDKDKATAIRKAFELYATGDYTLESIKQFLANAGIDSYRGNTLSCSCIQRILQNRFYYGVFKFNNEIYEGSHEPIISKKLFESVQQVMGNRAKKKRKRKNEFAFSGLMKCGNCGCAITAEKQKGHNYYRCTKKKIVCSEKYLREENLVEQIKTIIQKVSLSDEWADNMLAELSKDRNQIQKEGTVFVQNLQAQKYTIEQKMDKLLDLFIDGHGITPEEYQIKKAKLLNGKMDIDQEIRSFEQKGNNRLEPMEKMILESKQAKILLSQDNAVDFRQFLKNIGSNFVLKGKNLEFEGKIGWRVLLQNAFFPNWRWGQDSNLHALPGTCFQDRLLTIRNTPPRLFERISYYLF